MEKNRHNFSRKYCGRIWKSTFFVEENGVSFLEEMELPESIRINL